MRRSFPVLSLALASTLAAAQPLVLTAERILDVVEGRYLERPQLLIEDGRIRALGRAGDEVPANARRIDLPGLTLLPGLIDMHVHLTGHPRYQGMQWLDFTDNFWTAIGVANAKGTLEAGFTTVRSMGAWHYADVALKQAIEQGHVPGPRIVPSTMMISATGGHADATGFPPSLRVERPPGTRPRPWAVRRTWAVRASGAMPTLWGCAAIRWATFVCCTGRPG